MKPSDFRMNAPIEDPLSPVYFLIIFGQEDFVELKYPEHFVDEKTIGELIHPRWGGEVEKIASLHKSNVPGVDWYKFEYNNTEIPRMLEFNGKHARRGLTLEQFRTKVREDAQTKSGNG